MTIRPILPLLGVLLVLAGCGSRKPFGLGPEAHQPRLLYILDVVDYPTPAEFAHTLADARAHLPNTESAPVAAVRINVDVRRAYAFEHDHLEIIRTAGFVPWVRFSDAPTSATPQVWERAAESFGRANTMDLAMVEIALGNPASTRLPEILARMRPWMGSARMVLTIPEADESLQPASGNGLIADSRLVDPPGTVPVRWPRRAAPATYLVAMPQDSIFDIGNVSSMTGRLLKHIAAGDVTHAVVPLDGVARGSDAIIPLHFAQRIAQRADTPPATHRVARTPAIDRRIAAYALIRPPGTADPFRPLFEDWNEAIVLWSRNGIVPVEVTARGGGLTGRVMLVTPDGRIVVMEPPEVADSPESAWQLPRRVRLDVNEQPIVLFVHSALGIAEAPPDSVAVHHDGVTVAPGAIATVEVARLGDNAQAHWEPLAPVRVARSGGGALSVRPDESQTSGSWQVPVVITNRFALPAARLLVPVVVTQPSED